MGCVLVLVAERWSLIICRIGRPDSASRVVSSIGAKVASVKGLGLSMSAWRGPSYAGDGSPNWGGLQ